MSQRTAALITALGFLLAFGAVGGMEDPTKQQYFLEQLSVAIVGLGLAWVGTLRLSQDRS